MSVNLYGSICLSDIPKELIITHSNGKKYLNVSINERRETDRTYGTTHNIKIDPPKGVPTDGLKLYIGNLKPSAYSLQRQSERAMQQAQAQTASATTDVPF